ncbi:MAG: hypothetical protein FWD08_06310 [Alphaproteobacteria bacterium]|nr:hypothetical protein [Alphaproteobacteria bacterium]
MRLLRMFVALCLMGEAAASNVDPGLVGVWTMEVPNDQGTARWVWDVHADGTYSFHAEGPGNVPAHGGSFAGFAGHYLLNSTTLSWTDAGTYQLQGDSMLASGKLGKGYRDSDARLRCCSTNGSDIAAGGARADSIRSPCRGRNAVVQ